MKDGRLDEAYELLRDAELRAHRKGQQLIGRVARALATRGEEHLAAGRLDQATADQDKAWRLAGNIAEVTDLKAKIEGTAHDQHEADRRRANAVAAARDHAANGMLTMAEGRLKSADEDLRVTEIQNELGERRRRGESALGRAREAWERKDAIGMIAALVEARHHHATNHELEILTHEVIALVARQAGDAFDRGRIDLAGTMIEKAQALGQPALELDELSRCIAECRGCDRMIGRGELRRACETLRRLASIRPKASWLNETLQAVTRAAEGLEQVRSGPLGLVSGSSPDEAPETQDPNATAALPAPSAKPVPPAKPAPNGGGRLPRRFLLQIDGVGSFLVVRDSRVTVGPASTSRRQDVGLLADSGLPTITLERSEEDYFLDAPKAVQVNDAAVTKRLLADGDRIALGPRCRFKFTRPNAASSSAVVHLSGSRLPRGDARRVVLMDDAIIIGPGSSAHIRADQLAAPIVLHVRDDRLFARSDEPVAVDDRPMDRNAGIPLEGNVRAGTLAFVVTAA